MGTEVPVGTEVPDPLGTEVPDPFWGISKKPGKKRQLGDGALRPHKIKKGETASTLFLLKFV